MVTSASWGLWLYLACQRLWELRLARRNERAMAASGGREHSSGHYPAIFALHALFFALLGAAIARGALLDPTRISWLCLFAAAQGLRFWSVSSLGQAWSTRIWSMPGRPLVSAGPYRYLRHPIYLAVVLEIFSVPMAYGLPRLAFALSAANGLLLAIRVRAEERVLAREFVDLPSGKR